MIFIQLCKQNYQNTYHKLSKLHLVSCWFKCPGKYRIILHLIVMSTSPYCHEHFTLLSWALHLIVMSTSPYCHEHFTLLSWALHLIVMSTSPYCHEHFTLLSWALHLIVMSTNLWKITRLCIIIILPHKWNVYKSITFIIWPETFVIPQITRYYWCISPVLKWLNRNDISELFL